MQIICFHIGIQEEKRHCQKIQQENPMKMLFSIERLVFVEIEPVVFMSVA